MNPLAPPIATPAHAPQKSHCATALDALLRCNTALPLPLYTAATLIAMSDHMGEESVASLYRRFGEEVMTVVWTLRECEAMEEEMGMELVKRICRTYPAVLLLKLAQSVAMHENDEEVSDQWKKIFVEEERNIPPETADVYRLLLKELQGS